MDLINNSKYKIILGSSSSRRRELLELTGINFTVQTYTINEDFPDNLKAFEIAEYIVSNKNEPFKSLIKKNEIILTADTLVWYKNKCWVNQKIRMKLNKC